MQDPKLYESGNKLQKLAAKLSTEKYKWIINWCPNGDDTILDIGCGPGDVTVDFILSILPLKFRKSDAIDLSARMIEHANDVYRHPKINFMKMDFSVEISEHPDEKYDHIFSYFCLNWIPNRKIPLKNIYNLLQSNGGDCLLTIATKVPAFGVYLKLKDSPKFAKYCHDADSYISPYYLVDDPKTYVENLLRSIGFRGYLVETVTNSFNFTSEFLRKTFQGFDPFISRMPKDLRGEYMTLFMETFIEQENLKYINGEQLLRFDYQYLTVYARK